MDTSDSFTLAHKILHGDRIRADTITPETWMYLIEEVYKDSRLGEMRSLYRRFGDLTDGHTTNLVDIAVPRGVTSFSKGIGVNTLVRLSPVSVHILGKQLSPGNPGIWSEKRRWYLLLLKRESESYNMPLGWAHWELNSSTVRLPGKGAYANHVSSSSVAFMERADVLQIFTRHPSAARFLLDLSADVDFYAQKLKEQAYEFARLSSWMCAFEHRIGRE